MSDELETWPERIWLQHGDSAEVPNYADCNDVSWCWHKVEDADIEYVRADRIAALEKEIAEHSDMLTIAYLDGVAFQRRRVEELERQNAELRNALRSVNAVAIERGDKFGVCDQIDNDGAPYQSQWFANILNASTDKGAA